jgi:hypothetical protein
VDLSRVERETDMVEHFDVAEALGDVADEREGVRGSVPCHRRHRRLLLSLTWRKQVLKRFKTGKDLGVGLKRFNGSKYTDDPGLCQVGSRER